MKHGAGTAAARKKSAKSVELFEVQRQVRRLAEPRDIDPESGLLEEVRRTAGHIAFIESVLADINPEALVWGRAQTDEVHASEFPGTNTREKAGLNTWLEWLLREREHYVRVCSTAIKCGILRRQIEMEEEFVGAVVALIRRIIIGIGMTPTDPAVAAVVTRELRSMSRREPPPSSPSHLRAVAP